MHHQRKQTERMRSSDEVLVQEALHGDNACFGELAERWQGKIFGFICRYVDNREEARDLTQDTFAKAFENLSRLSDPARFSSWLYSIALNECRMRFRRLKRYRQVDLDSERGRLEDWEAGEAIPDQVLEAKENVVRLKAALRRLPREQEEVIVMKEYQGLKFHEIAEILDIPVSTAKSRLYLGLKTLRGFLEESDDV
jgi:RNA polymerase sigma-70 factor (ECF subfamily)